MSNTNRLSSETVSWDCPACGATGADALIGDEAVGCCEACDGSGEAEVCAGCCECAQEAA